MTAEHQESQTSNATIFERPTDITGRVPAISIDGFSFDETYPHHAAGEDGKVHAPAEGLIERKVVDVIEVGMAKKATIEIIEDQMRKLVEVTQSSVENGDLFIPSLVGAKPEQDLTHHLKGLLNQNVLEAHRRVIADNQAQAELIAELRARIQELSPDQVPVFEEKLGGRALLASAPDIERIPSGQERIPSTNTLERIFSGPIKKASGAVLDLLGVHHPGKHVRIKHS